jgi:hypothetical protein
MLYNPYWVSFLIFDCHLLLQFVGNISEWLLSMIYIFIIVWFVIYNHLCPLDPDLEFTPNVLVRMLVGSCILGL